MRRRLFSTILMTVATTVMLICGTGLGYWVQWVASDQQHVRAGRTATVFIESNETGVVAQALTKIRAMPGVAEARQIAVEEFMDYLRRSFPDIAQAMEGMTADAFPNLVEVVVPRERTDEARKQTFDEMLSVPGVVRVDTGAKQIRSAVDSLAWLARGGMVVGIGLWLVLLTIAMGHFQGILFREAQEIRLLRSFGASSYWICLPWIVEGLLYALLATLSTGLIFWYGQGIVSQFFNQFFEVLGYDAFQMTLANTLKISLFMFAAAGLAHIAGTFVAIFRGKLA